METIPNPENREETIHRFIENFAEREGMNSGDIFSDIITFAELYETDKDTRIYFEEIAEAIGVSFEEIIEYAMKQLQDHLSD